MKGYLVKFFGKGEQTAFCDTLEEAISLRDMIHGGGTIYAAHIEESGFNAFVVLDYPMRKSDGTLI